MSESCWRENNQRLFGHYRGAAAALGISAMGSALGCGTAGMSAITMWKKAYAQGKNALFTLLVFVGTPISQTIYGMLLMNFILNKAAESGFTSRAASAPVSSAVLA
ncbi:MULTISPECIES: hypothetical protein [unclassified Fibrobacter]|uniref:hypothetical protein n=1 Tax=unclassified Fibrobacter TaxID=2634177 RepID=UPI001E48F286|nr:MULTISPECIES: hypothetical protein [unclassified Fibrobacter]